MIYCTSCVCKRVLCIEPLSPFPQGCLWRYIRSSMSYPMLFPPLCDPKDGRLLVDGAFVNNLPGTVLHIHTHTHKKTHQISQLIMTRDYNSDLCVNARAFSSCSAQIEYDNDRIDFVFALYLKSYTRQLFLHVSSLSLPPPPFPIFSHTCC